MNVSTVLVRNQFVPIGLVPMYGSDVESLQKVKTGKEFISSANIPLSIEMSRKFRAMCRCVIHNLPENLSELKNMDNLVDVLKHETGHVRIIKTLSGEEWKIPKSISPKNISEPEFKDFFKASLDVVITKLMPGNTSSEILKEIIDFY